VGATRGPDTKVWGLHHLTNKGGWPILTVKRGDETMNPQPAYDDHQDDDPTILTPEEEAEDLRDIREAKAEIEKSGGILFEDLMKELGL